MPQGSRFFTFDQSLRWFKAVGTISIRHQAGGAKVKETVHEQSLAEPGDVAHALVDGTFLVRRDGSVESGRITPPRPVSERSRGALEADADILARLSSRGVCRELRSPGARVAYKATLKAVDAVRFPMATGVLSETNATRSPLLRTLEDAVDGSSLARHVGVAGGALRLIDVGVEANSLDATLRVEIPDGVNLDVRMSPLHGMLMLYETGDGLFVEALQSVDDDDLGLSPEHRTARITAVPVDECEALMQVLARYVERGQVVEPKGPRP